MHLNEPHLLIAIELLNGKRDLYNEFELFPWIIISLTEKSFQRCDIDLNGVHLFITIKFIMNTVKRDLCNEINLFQREIMSLINITLLMM